MGRRAGRRGLSHKFPFFPREAGNRFGPDSSAEGGTARSTTRPGSERLPPAGPARRFKQPVVSISRRFVRRSPLSLSIVVERNGLARSTRPDGWRATHAPFLADLNREEHTAPAAPMGERISVTEARVRLTSSEADALVVCAYDDPEKCEKIRLAGALALHELKAMGTSLSTGRELIFYCA